MTYLPYTEIQGIECFVNKRETKEGKGRGMTHLQKTLTKLAVIRSELNASFYERESEIEGLLIALLAREHVLLLGPPGTAKSALARAVCQAIVGATFFRWLMTKFSTPEEIFGPISLKGLEKDEVRRLTRNKLPEASIAFLDEVFKANSAILNSLLTIINEREFDNGDAQPMDCPLDSMVGASNELPENGSLSALFDRFLIRYWVEPLSDRDNMKALLLSGGKPSIKTSLTRDELKSLQDAVDNVTFTADIIDALLKLKDELASIELVASDRRWCKIVRAIKAKALLDGRDAVEEEDLLALADMMWTEPTQRPMLREKVGAIVSPVLAEAIEVLDAARESDREIRALNRADTTAFIDSVSQHKAELLSNFNGLKQSIIDSGVKPSAKIRNAVKEIQSIGKGWGQLIAEISMQGF